MADVDKILDGTLAKHGVDAAGGNQVVEQAPTLDQLLDATLAQHGFVPRTEHSGPVATILDAASDGATYGLDKDLLALGRSEPTHEAARSAIQRRRDQELKDNPVLYRAAYYPASLASAMLPVGWLGRGAKVAEALLPNANLARMGAEGATVRQIMSEGAKAGAKTGALEGFSHTDNSDTLHTLGGDVDLSGADPVINRLGHAAVDAGTSAVFGGAAAPVAVGAGKLIGSSIERLLNLGPTGTGDVARAIEREGQGDVVGRIKDAILPGDVAAVTKLPAKTSDEAAERAATALRALGGDSPTNAHVTEVRRAIEADPDWHRAFGPGVGSDRVGAGTLNKKIREAHAAYQELGQDETEQVLRDYGAAIGGGQNPSSDASARAAAATALAQRNGKLTTDTAKTLVDRAVDGYRDKNQFPAQLHELVALATGGGGRATHKLYRAVANLEGDGTVQSRSADWVAARQGTQGGRVTDLIKRHLGDGDVESQIERYESQSRAANADYKPILTRPATPDGMPSAREFALADTLGARPDPESLLGGRQTEEARRAWFTDPKNAADYAAAQAQQDIWDRVAAARASGLTSGSAAKQLRAQADFDNANEALSKGVQGVLDRYTAKHAGKQTSLAKGVDAGVRTMQRRNVQTFLEGIPHIVVPPEVEALGEDAVGNYVERQMAKQFARDGKPGPKITRPIQSLEEFIEARQDLRQEIEASKQMGRATPLTSELNGLYKELTKVASGTHPEWAKINTARAAPERLREAYEMGLGINFKAVRGKSALDYAKQLRGFEAMSPEQQAMFRRGLSEQLSKALEAKTATHNMAGPFQNEATQKMLRRVLGNDDAAAIIDHLNRVGLATRTNQATKGSHTAPLNDMKDHLGSIAHLAHALFHFNPFTAVTGVLRHAGQHLERTRYDAITELLTRNTDNPAELLAGLDAIEQAGARSGLPGIQAATTAGHAAVPVAQNRALTPFIVDNRNEASSD